MDGLKCKVCVLYNVQERQEGNQNMMDIVPHWKNCQNKKKNE